MLQTAAPACAADLAGEVGALDNQGREPIRPDDDGPHHASREVRVSLRLSPLSLWYEIRPW